MNKLLRCLIVLLFFLIWILPSAPVLAGASKLPPFQEETVTPPPEETTPSAIYPIDIINAVNDLRMRSGLPALAVHQALMDVAAQTANALAATEGGAGHYRPCNMTLGQLLLVRDFALWGDLSQDGYRSEDWVTADTVEQAVAFWLSDQLHSDTMLSPDRSHIGAAIAVSDKIYMVLETALQTPSGKMQWGADVYLTQAAVTKSACMGLSTQNAELGILSQYSVPVAMSTARPDGDVIHEVKYGQSLWSIAIQYGTTIEQIKQLNNLTSDTVVPGWTLLVQKKATQPAPYTATNSVLEPIKQDLLTPTPAFTPSGTESASSMNTGDFLKQNGLAVVAFVISFSVLVAAIVGFGKKKEG
jgi:LysM repeat protein/uncharacterized protein YkwD